MPSVNWVISLVLAVGDVYVAEKSQLVGNPRQRLGVRNEVSKQLIARFNFC